MGEGGSELTGQDWNGVVNVCPLLECLKESVRLGEEENLGVNRDFLFKFLSNRVKNAHS